MASCLHYSHPYRHYAEVFGIPERSIKRWVALGKKSQPPDLPPFDSPSELPAWWNRHSSQQIPARLLQFIAGEKPQVAANDTRDANLNEKSTDTPLRQAQKHLDIADCRLQAALMPDANGEVNESRIGSATRIWQDTLKVFLAAKHAAEEEQRIQGQWISRTEANEEILTLAEHLRQMRANLARRVSTALANFFNNVQLQQIQAAIVEAQANQDAIIRRFETMAAGEKETATLELTA